MKFLSAINCKNAHYFKDLRDRGTRAQQSGYVPMKYVPFREAQRLKIMCFSLVNLFGSTKKPRQKADAATNIVKAYGSSGQGPSTPWAAHCTEASSSMLMVTPSSTTKLPLRSVMGPVKGSN